MDIKALLLKYLSLILIFLSPLESSLFAVGFIVMCDFVTGIWAAKKNNQPITSKKMSATITKSALYLIAILVSFVCEKVLLTEIIPLTKVILGLIALTEIKSIFENINKVLGIDFWHYIKDYVTRKVKKEDEGK